MASATKSSATDRRPSPTGYPPDVTAAHFESRIPDVVVEPDATDTLGRSGIGIAYSDEIIRGIWVLDTQTHEVPAPVTT